MAQTLNTVATVATPRPRNVTAPSLSGTTTVGQILTCDPGYFTGMNLTLTYQWIRDASTTIAGATNATYLLDAADGGAHTVKCRVTATPADANYGPALAVTSPPTVNITP